MMNGLQTLPQWRSYFDTPQGAVLGFMNAVYPLGKVISLPIVTLVSDRFGRKIPLVFGLVTCVAFSVMQALAPNFGTFVAARALLGFCTSFISHPSPILIAELSYPTHRGKITALYNTFFVGVVAFFGWDGKTDSGDSISVPFLPRGRPTARSSWPHLGAGGFRLFSKGLFLQFSCWLRCSFPTLLDTLFRKEKLRRRATSLSATMLVAIKTLRWLTLRSTRYRRLSPSSPKCSLRLLGLIWSARPRIVAEPSSPSPLVGSVSGMELES